MGYISEGARAENSASKIIFDDFSLYGRTKKQLLEYFRTVQGVLKHHRDTLKLKLFKNTKTGVSFYVWMLQMGEHNLHTKKIKHLSI